MELVYLWVEDYKNIKNQGFSFSPRFECKYNEEKNELTIDEKDNYIPDFFGENINVTAIVGKNGSGKSSIQELIFLIIYLQYQQLSKDFQITQSLQFNNLIKNIFLVIYSGEKFRVLHLKDIVDKQKKDSILNDFSNIVSNLTATSPTDNLVLLYKKLKLTIEKLRFKKINFYSIYFNYTLDTWDSPIHITTWIDKLYHRNDYYSGIPLLLEPEKTDRKINIKNISYLNMQRMFNLYSELFNNTKSIKKYFTPNKIYMEFNYNKIEERIDDYSDSQYNPEELQNIIEKWRKYFIEIRDNNDYISINRVYLFFKIYKIEKNVKIEHNTDTLYAIDYLIKNLINENMKDYIDNFPISKIKLLRKLFNEKIWDCIYFDEVMSSNSNKLREYQIYLEKKEDNDIRNVFQTFDKLVPWINVSFFDNEKNYNSLSTGEKTLLNFSINMLYQIKNILSVNNDYTVNLFLDEVELSMHPQWQKRFLSDIINFLEIISHNKINIIFMTHSPFLLSDIPKQNIILLDTYNNESKEKYPNLNLDNLKDGNCINVSSEIDIKPFGANIHELLSHGFFMEDGLMGEFAKSKINKIIRFLNGDNKFIDFPIEQIIKVIESIGEDLLRMKLFDMYYEKFEKDELEKEKQKLLKQQEEIKKQIESIEGKQK